MTPFFSIIIPTYNRAYCIAEAIASVQAQDCADWELIVVDDGSTDNTAEVVRAIAANDMRIRYVPQPNAERSAARNHGISLAQGQYICFLDSDDEYLPDHLASFKQSIDASHGVHRFLACFAMAELEGNPLETRFMKAEGESDGAFCVRSPISPQQACIHRDVLAEHRFDPAIRMGEDRELWFRITEQHPLHVVGRATVLIKDRGDRTVSHKNRWAYEENLATVRHIIRSDRLGRLSHNQRMRMLGLAHLRLGQSLQREGSHAKAIAHLCRSLLLDPLLLTKDKSLLIISSITNSITNR